MKNILIAATALAIMSFAVTGPLPIGSAMPKADVKLKDVSGKEVSIKDAVKKMVCWLCLVATPARM